MDERSVLPDDVPLPCGVHAYKHDVSLLRCDVHAYERVPLPFGGVHDYERPQVISQFSFACPLNLSTATLTTPKAVTLSTTNERIAPLYAPTR